MIIDNEDIQEVQQYISDTNIVKLINDQKIHEVLRQAYQEVRTNDQYLFLYYALLKSGMFEEFDAPNYGFKVEKFSGAQIKVTVDFDRLSNLFYAYENYGSFGRDNIDFETCLKLIEDTLEVVKNWNYDDPSQYSDIQDDIAKGYINVNAESYCTSFTKFKVSKKSSSVSPGNPTIISVVIATSGISCLILFIKDI